MTAEVLINALRQSTLLAEMPPALVEAIASGVERVELDGGDVLFRQGDPGDSLFFVLSGRLRVQRAQAGGIVIIAEIVAGESVGEMAALTGDQRSATVVAIRNCRLARLTRDTLERLLRAHPEFLGPIAILLARRLGQSSRAGQTRKAASCFTLLRGSDGVDLDAITAKLAAALGGLGKVAVIGVDAMPFGFGAGQVDAKSAFADWANGLEAAHDFVLFVGSDELPEWNGLCLRQADLVLVCGDPGRAPPNRQLPSGAIPAWANVNLILCQGEGRPAVIQTRNWLDAFPETVHFNVRYSVPGDFARLARLLSGRGVGLVLGGGGARGMAHIGVVRALAEAGIPIDRVGGTSQGALVAATVAVGWDHRQMLEVFRKFRDDNPTNDFTVPTVSLIAGRKAERALKVQFGERRIEDLPIDFFCVSSNLTTGQICVHRRGPLHEALRATISIPGIFPPVPRDGELLVDGGVLDNLPIAPTRQRGEIKVVAVNVTFAHGLAPRRSLPSKRRVLRPWGRPRNPVESAYRLPSIVQTLMHAGTLGTIGRLDALRQSADLFIEPPVEGFRTLDWGRVEEIAEIGYRHARQCLERWKAG